MKPHMNYAQEGTVTQEGAVKFTMDNDNIDHLMALFTDMYKDRELAVLREYSTNALDAHVAAGNTAPIEVELPSALNPVLIVRDFGIGMSIDTITKQLSMYGWSSKRETDDQSGMLGIGFKAGLTYSPQFTVTSVREGVESIVLVSRQESGSPTLKVIDTCATDKPNGTVIQVPVSDVGRLTEKARFLFAFWERGTVLVDGKEPRSWWDHDEALALDPDVVIFSKQSSVDLHQSYVVMGNVPYPVSSEKGLLSGRGNYEDTYFVARVPIGSFSFTPNREEMMSGKSTDACLESVRDFVLERRAIVAQERIDNAPTRMDGYFAWLNFSAWTKKNKRDPSRAMWRGEVIPDYVPLGTVGDHPNPKMVDRDGKRAQVLLHPPLGILADKDGYGHTKTKTWDDRSGVPISLIPCVDLIVYGYKGSSVHISLRERARMYVLKRGGQAKRSSGHMFRYERTILFVDQNPKSPWVEHIPTISMDDLKNDTTLVKPPRKSTKVYSPVRWLNPQGNLDSADAAPRKPDTWFRSGEIAGAAVRYRAHDFVRSVVGNERPVVLVIPKDREAWMATEYPDVPHLADFYKTAMEDAAENMTDWERVTFGPSGFQVRSEVDNLMSLLCGWREGEIKYLLDPDLHRFIRKMIPQRTKTNRPEIMKHGRELWHFHPMPTDLLGDDLIGMVVPPESRDWLKNNLKWIYKRYPLLNSVRSQSAKNMRDYVNGVYLLKQQGLDLAP